MITISVSNCNSINQKIYDDLILNLQVHQLTCPCGVTGLLKVHGYYYRSVKLPTGKTRLSITRLKCESCHKTHAILPMIIIPYSQVLMADQLAAIEASKKQKGYPELMSANPEIDESNITSIIKRYKQHWKQRLLSAMIKITTLQKLIEKCFHHFKMHFMQIKNTPNILFC